MAPSERVKRFISVSIGIFAGGILGVGLSQYYLKHKSIIAPLSLPLPPDGDHKRGSEILKYGFPGPISDTLFREAYGTLPVLTGIPNWVAEHLNRDALKRGEDDGDRHRSHFKEDKQIPPEFRAKLADYIGSDFDRGHMAPAADIHGKQSMIDESFLLTNVSPQVAHGFNRGYWAHFEKFIRHLTTEFDDIYVVTGPMFLPKKEDDGQYYIKYRVLGDPPNTSVPTHFWKVVLAVKDDKNYAGAFVLPNELIPETMPLAKFITPVSAIERATGLLFFSDLRKDVDALLPLCSHTKCSLKNFHHAFQKTNVKKNLASSSDEEES